MQLFQKLAKAGGENTMVGAELSPEMMKMMGGFTLIRMINMMGTMGLKPTKAELLELNAS